jgi:flagellar hook-associated protein 1 FlgK
MGLTSSLLIGRTALAASQVALQMTGNNIANATTPGYSRQRISTVPLAGEQFSSGVYLGRGVGVDDIRRVVDPALQARVRSSLGDEASASVEVSIMNNIESLTNELTGIDISSELTSFFNAFSELANNPSGVATRTTVVEQGASVASSIRSLRSDLIEMRTQLEQQLAFNVNRADELVSDIAGLNQAIVNAELGQGEESNLRDQRDALITELSGLLDISTVEQASGAVDVLVSSVPVVLGSTSRGLELDVRSDGDGLDLRVRTTVKEEELTVTSGSIGALLEQYESAATSTIEDLDTLASQLIFQVNRLHSAGRPVGGLTSLRSTLEVAIGDQSLALNDPSNQTFADLPFAPSNGSFRVTMYDANGNRSDTTIFVDLDGIDSAGLPGFGDDTTMADIVAALDAIPNLNATITPEGAISLTTDTGFDVAFGDDTSGALATLGINSFFDGTTGQDIAVRQAIRDDTTLLTVGESAGTNETALAIASLRSQEVDALSGRSLLDSWLETVENNAVRTSAANTRFSALQSVRESLEAQQTALSGVSLDEESINLVLYQQQYQGAARFISVTNELTDVLLTLV